MNYIVLLYNFYQRANKDKRLKPWHISLYMALFNEWNRHRFEPVFRIFREEMMSNSHIGSKNTLTKALKELHEFRYIIYHPALHPEHYIKIAIIIRKDSPTEKQPDLFTEKGRVPNMTGGAPDVNRGAPDMTTYPPIDGLVTPPTNGEVPPPFMGHTNKQNKQNKTIEYNSNELFSQKNESLKIPGMEEVLTWFDQQHADSEIALSFFYHYSANGWMMGLLPMRNWQAAASKWIIRNKKLPDHRKQNPLQTKIRKNYGNPL
jgi:hypothetical protein